jgi:hypothetical protein
MVKIVYGVCVGDWDRFRANVLPPLEGKPVIAVSGQDSIAVAYNSIMEAAYEMRAMVLILQHDDLEIMDPDAEDKIFAGLDEAALVGVAGGMDRGGIAWWNHDPVGHQTTDVSFIDFGVRTGPVDLLEGSLLAISGAVMLGLRFDPLYPGFHGYDVDISRQVRENGFDVAVVDVDTHHHTQMGYKSESSHRDWLEADRIFRAKWGQP